MEEKVVLRGGGRVLIEGRYRRGEWVNGQVYWQLTHWRVGMEAPSGMWQQGGWEKVHHRQRKPCAGLEVILSDRAMTQEDEKHEEQP